MTAKRIFDLAGVLALLMVFLPLMLLIALAIKMTSPGPIIFKQERVGYRGRPFIIWKFRTMAVGSGRSLDVIEKGDDPRVTIAGRFLRPTHLDELPQLWNVLKGDMSLVGPRPRSADIEETFKALIPGYEKRYLVRPGITGPSQLRTRAWLVKSREEAHCLEVEYIERRNSVAHDALILFQTVMAVIGRRGA